MNGTIPAAVWLLVGPSVLEEADKVEVVVDLLEDGGLADGAGVVLVLDHPEAA